MEFLRLLLLFLHFVGLASLIGGFLVQVSGPERRIIPAIRHGAYVQLVTGVLLVGVNEALDEELTYPKFGAKLLIALVIAVAVFVLRNRPSVATGGFFGLFGLSLLNVGIAVFWT